MFPAYLQISPYLQIYRSVSPDLQICIVTPAVFAQAPLSVVLADGGAPAVLASVPLSVVLADGTPKLKIYRRSPHEVVRRGPTPKPARCRHGPREPPRLVPCAVPARLADAAVLLARIVTVHDGRRLPARTS
jgi:hypothetical protein